MNSILKNCKFEICSNVALLACPNGRRCKSVLKSKETRLENLCSSSRKVTKSQNSHHTINNNERQHPLERKKLKSGDAEINLVPILVLYERPIHSHFMEAVYIQCVCPQSTQTAVTESHLYIFWEDQTRRRAKEMADVFSPSQHPRRRRQPGLCNPDSSHIHLRSINCHSHPPPSPLSLSHLLSVCLFRFFPF